MTPILELESARLRLRQWQDDDLAEFAALCADPLVMQYFPAPLSRVESAALIGRIRGHFAEYGFGLWALERQDSGAFIGMTGLLNVSFDAPFTPAVEIGWRLGTQAWGHGYAREAAEATLRDLRQRLGLVDIVSFTVAANRASWGLMERLGFRRDVHGDFAHPQLPADHPLSLHWLYRARLDEEGRPC